MKRSITFALVMAMMAATSFAVAQEEKTETAQLAWFDMDNCDVCKSMAQHKDMIPYIKWETHLLDNGALSVSVIPEKFKATMSEAKKDMKKAIARLEAGEKLKCCGYCNSYGTLIGSGAKITEISTAAGDLVMLTSDNEDVVKKIHAHANKTIAEHKKMMEQMKHHPEQSGDHKEAKKGSGDTIK